MEQTTTWPFQIPNQKPNSNPNPNPPQPQQPISTSICSYYPPPHPPDPQNSIVTSATAQFYANSNPTTTATTLWPPGVDYSYTSYHSVGYYFDPISHNWAAKAAVSQYGSDPGAVYATSVSTAIRPNGTEQLAIAHLGSTAWINHALQHHGIRTQKKRQKKTKVVQSAYCEICKVDCNSKDVLDVHKLGKKHKKNLEKLQAPAAGCSASAGSSNPVIGPQEDPNKIANGVQQKSKKKKAEPLENLETKRRKMVEGGAAAEAVRACSICNVVCNSETVFNAHLAGQKHATMLKKHTGGRRVATAI